jgi:hypothetical protein
VPSDGPAVPRREGGDHAAAHGVARVLVRLVGAEGGGDHVHAVGDRVVEGGEDVLRGAAVVAPAHLVDGQPRAGHRAAGRAARHADQARVRHRAARRRRRRVRAVALLVHGGHRPVALQVRPRSDDLAAVIYLYRINQSAFVIETKPS